MKSSAPLTLTLFIQKRSDFHQVILAGQFIIYPINKWENCHTSGVYKFIYIRSNVNWFSVIVTFNILHKAKTIILRYLKLVSKSYTAMSLLTVAYFLILFKLMEDLIIVICIAYEMFSML